MMDHVERAKLREYATRGSLKYVPDLREVIPRLLDTLAAAERAFDELDARHTWMLAAACGEELSDFALSFSDVRLIADLRAIKDAAEQKRDTLASGGPSS